MDPNIFTPDKAIEKIHTIFFLHGRCVVARLSIFEEANSLKKSLNFYRPLLLTIIPVETFLHKLYDPLIFVSLHQIETYKVHILK